MYMFSDDGVIQNIGMRQNSNAGRQLTLKKKKKSERKTKNVCSYTYVEFRIFNVS